MTLQIDKGSRTQRRKVAVQGVRVVKGVRQVVSFSSIYEARLSGFEPSGISGCLNGTYKTHAGYEWSRIGKTESKVKGPCRLRQVAHMRNVLKMTNEEIAKELELGVGRIGGLMKDAKKEGLLLFTGHDMLRMKREREQH